MSENFETSKKIEGIAEKLEHEPKLNRIIEKLVADGYTHPGESLRVSGFATAENLKFFKMVEKRAPGAGEAVAVIELVALMNPPADADGSRAQKFATERKDKDYLLQMLDEAGYTATAETGDFSETTMSADYYVFLKK